MRMIADMPKFNQSILAIQKMVGGTVEEHIPYVAASSTKWAMNQEKVPKSNDPKIEKKSRIKAGYATNTDFASNDPGTYNKNVYINTGRKYGKVMLVVEHSGTGQTYFPVYANSDFNRSPQVITRKKTGKEIPWTDSTINFVESKIREYQTAQQRIYQLDLAARLLPKTPWYDILRGFEGHGVDLSLVTPKGWSGGKKGIQGARVLHNGRLRPNFGTVIYSGDLKAIGGFTITVVNAYPAWEQRRMDKRLEAGVRNQLTKVEGDIKRKVFEDRGEVTKRYPWIQILR